MDQESVISDIETRARCAGVTIRELCIRAAVHPTTFSRWKKSERNPNPLGASLLSVGRLYDALEAVGDQSSSPNGLNAPDSVATRGDSHRLCGAAK